MAVARNNDLKSKAKRIVTRVSGKYPRRNPSFIVVGATRSGTTTLNRLFGSHPEIFVPKSELHYFNNDAVYAPSLKKYRLFFNGYKGQRYIGEVTPTYCEKGMLYDVDGSIKTGCKEDAMVRISKSLPDIKLIISLRDPVARIKSIYLKNFYQGKVSHSLEEELVREVKGKSRLRLVERSQYKRDLEHIFGLFPKKNVKVVVFEEWIKNQETTMEELFEFIGCTRTALSSSISLNDSGRYKKNKETRNPETKIPDGLSRYLTESICESKCYVQGLLNRQIPWELSL